MKFETEALQMCGPYSAIFTPFDPDLAVDLVRLAEITEYQIGQGILGFFVTGSTGEGLLLTYEERLSVIRQVVQTAHNRATVIAHVGHPSTQFAANLARDAADAGADWIASVAPIYHGTTFDGAMRHYGEISSATDLPFMIYSLGGVIEPHRDPAFFELPNICGLKYTGGNFYSVQQMLRFVDRPIALMSGFDEQFVAGQSFGFQGGIGTTFNFAAQFYSQIYQSYQTGDITKAARIQADINRVTELMVRYENWSYRKAIMRYIGFDCGPCRAPYAPLTESEYQTFAGALDQLGVLTRADG
ncbi:MAG: dihydrodipicolinate synthase family protein [Mariniblastus sp.]|nr:dihydrodipicolinate synthase family protein [Mariniblastus sp.]